MPLIRNRVVQPATAEVEMTVASFVSATEEVRWAAARGAGAVADVPVLAEVLGMEKNARVREALFTALTRIAAEESVAVLLPYLRVDDADLRTCAMDALRAMPAIVKPHLQDLLSDPDPDVRLLTCELVRHVGGDDGARWLCQLLDTEAEVNVCAAAIEVLVEIADVDALPALSRCALRFSDDPFLTFALEVAIGRLETGALRRRG